MKHLSRAAFLLLALTFTGCGDFLNDDGGGMNLQVTVADNWEFSTTPYPFIINPRALHFPSTTVGFIVGINGEIFKTSDSGSSWEKMKTVTNLPLFSVMMLNDQVGFAGGHAMSCGDADCNKGSILLKTTDGGKTWSKTFFKDYSRIDCLYFFDELVGLAIIDTPDLPATHDYHLARTIDGGSSWEFLDVNIIEKDKFQVVDDVVYALGPQKIFKSKDHGATWQTIDTPLAESHILMRDVYFFNENLGFIDGVSTFHRTADGGSTWQQISPGFTSFGIFHMFDEMEGINVEAEFRNQGGVDPVFQGTSVYHTTNGGQTWKKEVSSNSLYVAWASFPDRAFGIGSNYAEFLTIRRTNEP